MTLLYRRVNWKYVVESESVVYQTRVKNRKACITNPRGALLAMLREDGALQIWQGYGWDGPSGPALDTRSFISASLVHDCLYQMIAVGELPLSCRKAADQTMRDIAKANGMGSVRRWYTYTAVRWFGKKHALVLDDEIGTV